MRSSSTSSTEVKNRMDERSATLIAPSSHNIPPTLSAPYTENPWLPAAVGAERPPTHPTSPPNLTRPPSPAASPPARWRGPGCRRAPRAPRCTRADRRAGSRLGSDEAWQHTPADSHCNYIHRSLPPPHTHKSIAPPDRPSTPTTRTPTPHTLTHLYTHPPPQRPLSTPTAQHRTAPHPRTGGCSPRRGRAV